MASNFKECYGNDISRDLILLLKQVKTQKFQNPHITREKWNTLKESTKPSAERAFAGHACSYGGVKFNGYINDPLNNDMEYSSLIKLSTKIQNVKFSNMDYISFIQGLIQNDKKYVIYLDPPYKKGSQPWNTNFDSKEFWNVVRKLGHMKNIKVFISELNAPSDIKCIYKLTRRNGMHNVASKNLVIEEKIYTI